MYTLDARYTQRNFLPQQNRQSVGDAPQSFPCLENRLWSLLKNPILQYMGKNQSFTQLKKEANKGRTKHQHIWLLNPKVPKPISNVSLLVFMEAKKLKDGVVRLQWTHKVISGRRYIHTTNTSNTFAGCELLNKYLKYLLR